MAGQVKLLSFSQGVSVTTPGSLGVTAKGLVIYATDAAFEIDFPSPSGGEQYYNSTDNVPRSHDGTAWADSGAADPLYIIRYELNTSQTAGSYNQPIIKYATKLTDADDDYSTSTGAWTCPTGGAGTYEIYAQTRVTGSLGSEVQYQVKKNDLGNTTTGQLLMGSQWPEPIKTVYGTASVVATDTISFHMYAENTNAIASAASWNTSQYFYIKKLG